MIGKNSLRFSQAEKAAGYQACQREKVEVEAYSKPDGKYDKVQPLYIPRRVHGR